LGRMLESPPSLRLSQNQTRRLNSGYFAAMHPNGNNYDLAPLNAKTQRRQPQPNQGEDEQSRSLRGMIVRGMGK
jgi:hypothetical protein